MEDMTSYSLVLFSPGRFSFEPLWIKANLNSGIAY